MDEYKEYTRKCVCCKGSFQTIYEKDDYCYRVTCEETGKLLEIEQIIDRLVRVITPNIIKTKTGRRNLKNRADFLINRNKNRYFTIKNLPKGRNGMTAKYDIVTQEIVYRTFDDLSINR